ncbi:ABC transporter ATP-binding protein [Clostridia bacterium]|nr:ABC transporter ATP-binding protein [Clostridia bacterium]
MENILSVRDVRKSYPKNPALDGVSFDVGAGQIVGLLGPNGSGKTTLIKIINTLITNYTGEILVCGRPLGRESKAAISYLPDCEYLRRDMSIASLLDMYTDFFPDFDKAKGAELVRVMNLEANKRVRQLSKGMKEKLQLALTMSRRAKLYIFDEPIAGVDPAARDFILDTIIRNYNDKGSVLFSTHLISDVEGIISRAVFIKEGKIILDQDADSLRGERGQSIDQIFREEFKC